MKGQGTHAGKIRKPAGSGAPISNLSTVRACLRVKVVFEDVVVGDVNGDWIGSSLTLRVNRENRRDGEGEQGARRGPLNDHLRQLVVALTSKAVQKTSIVCAHERWSG